MNVDLFARFPSLLLAWRNLWRHRVRTVLAMAGIVIGVVAIAAIGMTGTALEYGVTQDLGGLANEVTVFPGEDNEDDGFTEMQIQQIRRIATGATVVPVKSDRLEVSTRAGEIDTNVEAMARPSALYTASEGEIPDPLRSGAVVSSTLAGELDIEVNDAVTVGDRTYRVRAIYEVQGFTFGPGTVVLPESALREEPFGSIEIRTESGEASEALAGEIEAQFNVREEIVQTSTPGDIQEAIGGVFQTLRTALIGIGSISLLVAAVSILNVMLMSTIERRGEIGLLRAVGIRRIEVLRMIIAEALVLGVIGGLLGTVFSMVIGIGINASMFGDATLVLRWESLQFVLMGLAFAIIASGVSGLYPAWKAANDPPVEALRG